MFDSLRMILAEWLLGIIIKVVPNNKDGNELIVYIMSYLKKKINENI